MTRYKLILLSLFASFLVIVVGTYSKITHQTGADNILVVSAILYLVGVVIAVYEVMSSPRIQIGQKLLWLLCFLFLGIIGMFIYLLVGRKNIVEEEDASHLAH